MAERKKFKYQFFAVPLLSYAKAWPTLHKSTACPLPNKDKDSIGKLTLKLDPGHQVLMGRDGIDTAPLPKVPYFAGVVTAPSCNVVAVKQMKH